MKPMVKKKRIYFPAVIVIIVICIFALYPYLTSNGYPSSIDYFNRGKTEENLNILFFGDIMLDRDVKEKIESNNGNVKYLLDSLNERNIFDNRDIICANLEGAVTPEGKHYPPQNKYDFAFPIDYLKDLKLLNFNFFNLANNHILDQGNVGLKETREHLDKIGYDYVGCPDGVAGDHSITTLRKKGYNIGMIGVSNVYRKLDSEALKEKIKRLESSSDIVIVNVHWGEEYEHQFNKEQRSLAYSLIDSGADIIIGHHPHVIQGMEIHENRPIFYSLGNFIFDQYFSQDTQEGLAVELEFKGGKAEFNLLPIISRESLVDLPDENKSQETLNHFVKWSNLEKNPKENIKSGNFTLSFAG